MSKHKKDSIGMDMLLKMNSLHFAVPSIRDHMKHPGQGRSRPARS